VTYAIVVFLHIVGAMGLFAGIGLEQASLAAFRRVNTIGQARDWIGLLAGLRRLDGPSGLLILATGLYMMATRWGSQAWMGLAILAMIVIAFLSIAVTGRRARAIVKSLPTADGPISAALRERLADPALRASAAVRTALALGVVFNMSVKPTTLGALIVMGVALALGAASASPVASLLGVRTNGGQSLLR